MLSIEKSKKLLNENDEQFTDEEIIQIRDYFYHLTNIAIDNLLKNETHESSDEETCCDNE